MLSLPPWGRWRGAALRRTVTDEGSPPEAGLTAAVSTAATERVLGSPVLAEIISVVCGGSRLGSL